jgi:hypothetical protein
MPNPGELEFILKANPDDFVQGIKAAAEQTNRLTKQMDRAAKIGGWRKEQADAAREARRAAFDRLSVEEKIERTKQRQARLEEMMNRAQAKGNLLRYEHLKTGAAQNRNALNALNMSQSGGGIGTTILNSLGLGRLMMGGPGLALGGMGAGYWLVNQFRNAMATADELGGLADTLGIRRSEVQRLRMGADRASAGQDTGLNALGTLGEARASAIGGDDRLRRLFAAYGIRLEDLRNERLSGMDLAGRLSDAIGTGGPQDAELAALRSLLGRRPDRALAVIRGAQAANPGSSFDDDMAALDRIGSTTRQLARAPGNWLTRLFGSLARGNELVGQAYAGQTVGSDPAAAAAASAAQRARTAANAEEIARIMEAAPARPRGNFTPTPIMQIEADAMAKIGLFRGGFDPANRVRQEQLSALMRIEGMVRQLTTRSAASAASAPTQPDGPLM